MERWAEVRVWRNDILEWLKYNGKWKNGMCHGHGILVLSNGSTYEGEWEANNMVGEGILTSSEGDLFRGTWEADNFKILEVLNHKETGGLR
jgi:hypothetical protein